MSIELFYLSLTLAFTALLSFPYVLNRIAIRGLLRTMANPSVDDSPLSPWAQRAQRAHANAIENLALFAPAVILVQVLNLGSATTAFACALYFGSRVAHYVVYVAGIAVLRTVAFFGGWLGVALLIVRLLEMRLPT